jgi:hypothetical protein
MPKKRGRAAASGSPATAPPPQPPPPQAGALDDPLLLSDYPLLQSMDTEDVSRLARMGARFLNDVASKADLDRVLEDMHALLHGSEPLAVPQQRRGGSEAGLAAAKSGKAPPPQAGAGRARAVRVEPDASDDGDDEDVDVAEAMKLRDNLDELLRIRHC